MILTSTVFYRFTRVTSGGSKGWTGGTPCQNSAPLCPPNETDCKVAGLHNSCIHSVASRSWCQITPLTRPCIISSEIFAPSNTDVVTPLATPNCCTRNDPACDRRTDGR